MATEIPFTAPGLDDFLRKLDEAIARVRTLREESSRAGSSLFRSDPTERTDAEAHQRRRRYRQIEAQDEERAIRKRRAGDQANGGSSVQEAGGKLIKSIVGGDKSLSAIVGDARRFAGAIARDNPDSKFGGIAGKVKAALGPEVEIAADVVEGVVAGLKFANDLANEASAITRESSHAYYRGGGGPNMGAATGVGRFLGMSPTETADAANTLGDRLRSGGYGAAYLHSKGIVDFGTATTDKFTNLTKALDALRTEPNEQVAIRAARDLGMSDMLSVRDLSSDSYERLKKAHADSEVSPYERAQMAENDAADTEFGLQAESWKRQFGTSVGKAKRSIEHGDLIVGPSYELAKFGNPLRPLLEGSNTKDENGKWQHTKGLEDVIDGWMGKGEKAKNSAKDANTQAVENLTRTIKDHAELIGGGERARRAVPIGLKARMMDEALRNQAHYTGAFTVG